MAQRSQIGGIITFLLAAATIGVTIAIVVARRASLTPTPTPTPVPTPIPTPTPVPTPGETVDEAFLRINMQLASTQTRQQLVSLWDGGNIWASKFELSGAAYSYWLQLVATYQNKYASLPEDPVPVPIFDHRIVPPTYAPWVTAPDGTRYYQQVQSGEALDAWYAWVEAMGL